MKQIWRNLNQACSLSTTKENKGITELSDNGENIADNLLMSNVLNKYFATVGGSLPKKLQNNSPNSFISFKNYFDSPSKNSILVYPVSCEELSRLIANLNTSKSAGPDNIGPKLVKAVFANICTPLLYIFNLSLSNGIVPDQLKLAKVGAIYKKGEKKLACNYRPISLLSIFDKLLEKNYEKQII